MKTILIILAVIAVIVVIALIVIMRRKAIKADEVFEAKYGKFVGQKVWSIRSGGNKFFDDSKNIIADLEGFYCSHCCNGRLPEFFPCAITKIERYCDEKYKGRIKFVPRPFVADFEIKYISTTDVILYSEKYGELQLAKKETPKLCEELEKYTSPTVRLMCYPFIITDPASYGYLDFIIFWEIV